MLSIYFQPILKVDKKINMRNHRLISNWAFNNVYNKSDTVTLECIQTSSSVKVRTIQIILERIQKMTSVIRAGFQLVVHASSS